MNNHTLYVMGYEGVTVHSGLDAHEAQRMFEAYSRCEVNRTLNPFHASWYGPEGHVNSWNAPNT